MSDLYPRPILIREASPGVTLERIPLTGHDSKAAYSERWLQDLLYAHPEALPIGEIDESFLGLVPICCELNTPAGPIDVLYATPAGRIAALEAKLWRNPEARRKVIGQILDYAKSLSRWNFETLDAAVRQARKQEVSKGRPAGLIDVVRSRHPNLDEARFVDSVSRSLKRGDLLLLIAGDGIREGVGAIAEFLEGHGSLHFTFGLIEMGVYGLPEGGFLVQPRMIAQSEIVRRITVAFESGELAIREDKELSGAEEEVEEIDAALAKSRAEFSAYWAEFLKSLRLDDQSQPLPNGSRSSNLYFMMPQDAKGWISAFVAQSQSQAGVYLTFERGPIGDRLYAGLAAQRDVINRELDVPVEWSSVGGKHKIAARNDYSGALLGEHRRDTQLWLADRVNRFVTAFRPRILQLLRE